MKAARKYRNVPTVVDGIRFASKREAFRYCELKLLQKAGEIGDLRLQQRYPFILEGAKVGEYRADFDYVDHRTGRIVTEDVKGFLTRGFRLKAKMFKAQYGREIVIVK